MRIILLGAPGVGKGTQAKKISKKFDIPHISTGDILRSESKAGTGLGKKAREFMESGKLVPDHLIIEMMQDRLTGKHAGKGFLLDGFPRTVRQAEMFEGMLESSGLDIDRVINIIVDNDVIIKRLTDRRVCQECGHISKIDGPGEDRKKSCPKCGGQLYRRPDDDIGVIKKRLEVYKEQTRPLVDYYKKKGLLFDVDGEGSEEAVMERIISVL